MHGKFSALACVLALGGAVMVGCGDDDGPDPGTDSSVPMDSGGGGGDEPPVATLTGGGAPDWTCVGNVTAPAPGEPIAFSATFGGPLPPNLPDGTAVDFFSDNTVEATCGENCVTATTTSSVAMPTLPANGWFAYRVPMTTNSFPTVGYFRPAPAEAGANTSQTAIANTVVGIIPGVFGRERAPGTTVVSGAAYDCQGRPVGGVQARVFVGGTPVPLGDGRTQPFVGYLEGVSSTGTEWTSATGGGQFAVGNVQPGSTRIELWAKPAEGEALTRISCEEVGTFADTVIVVTPPALRSDYAAGSACAD